MSVSLVPDTQTPSWEDMCYIKDLFWSEDDWVQQFHPAKDDYVDEHPHCLHMWRPIGKEFPTPPAILVGLKKKGEVSGA